MSVREGSIALDTDGAWVLLRSGSVGRVIGTRGGLPDAFPICYWFTPTGLRFAPSEGQRFATDGQPFIVGVQAEGETATHRWTVMAIGPATLRPAALTDDRPAWDGSRPDHVVTVAADLLNGFAVRRADPQAERAGVVLGDR